MKTPITALVLMSMKYQLNFNNYDHIMFWAACCLAIFGFLRCSEFTVPSSGFLPGTHLTPSDIPTDKIHFPDSLMINIKKSKTDLFKRGFTIVLGKTDSQICPVAAMSTYLHLRGQKNGPMFIFKDGFLLTQDKFSRLVNQTVKNAGWQGNFTTHSFRVGAASTAAALGVPDHMIRAMGRWNSDAYLTYVKLPRQRMSDVWKTLATFGQISCV